MSKELVLKIGWGGLGDHLFYTPIPRIAKTKFNYDKVYISNYSKCRMPAHKEFIWGLNPYVDGFVDIDAPLPNFGAVREGRNLLDEVVSFCGLPDDGVRFREPEIYYKPKIIPELQNSVIIDINHMGSIKHPPTDLVEQFLNKQGIKATHQIRFKDNQNSISGVESLYADPIEKYCDVIASCKNFICFISGSATLAAALGKPSIVLYSSGVLNMFLHSKLHQYIQIN